MIARVRICMNPRPLASTLVLTALPARLAVATVTGVLAAVEATVQLVTADEGAAVLFILRDKDNPFKRQGAKGYADS